MQQARLHMMINLDDFADSATPDVTVSEDNNNNNNNNNQDNVYGAVIMAEPLQEFTRFI